MGASRMDIPVERILDIRKNALEKKVFLKELVVVSRCVEVTVLDYGSWVMAWSTATETAPKKKKHNKMIKQTKPKLKWNGQKGFVRGD